MKKLMHGCMFNIRAHTLKISLLYFFSSLATSAFGATIEAQLPSAFDPGLMGRAVQETFPQRPVTTSVPIQQEAPASAALPGGDKIRLTLNQVSFVGNKVFSNAELQKIFKPSLGKNISLADLQGLVDQVTKKYRAAGYILSRAILPPQEIKGGAVKVQIIEGYVSKVTIEGNTGNARAFLECYRQHILASRPLQVSLLEHEMLLANDLPGLTVRAVLNPSKNIPGSADLALVSERKLFDGYFAYDNYGTRFLGPLEMAFGGNVNSLIFPGDSNAVAFSVTSRGRELRFGQYTHVQPLGGRGVVWTVNTNYNQTEPEFLLDPLDIIGRSFSTNTNLRYPVIRSRVQNLYVFSALNYQNVTSTILGQPFYQDRIRSLTLGTAYDNTDSWRGSNTVGFDISHGFDIFGAAQHALQSRPKGNPDYSKFVVSASRLQPLGTSRYSLFASAQTQYAFDPLLATEQFSYGGPIYGRGYGPSEIVGDRGFAGKFEIRADVFPDLKFLKAIEFYTFYDGGVVWNLDKVNLVPKLSATSTGIGARVNFIPQLSAEGFIARPLTRPATTLTPIDQYGYQARGFFQLIARV